MGIELIDAIKAWKEFLDDFFLLNCKLNAKRIFQLGFGWWGEGNWLSDLINKDFGGNFSLNELFPNEEVWVGMGTVKGFWVNIMSEWMVMEDLVFVGSFEDDWGYKNFIFVVVACINWVAECSFDFLAVRWKQP